MRIHWDPETDGRCVIDFGTGDAAVREQAQILIRALEIYAERNPRYKDNWRRFGWRGCLFRVRERGERLWDSLWDAAADSHAMAGGSTEHEEKLDDAIDLINFAAFLVRAVRMNNRDGSWFGVSGPEWNQK